MFMRTNRTNSFALTGKLAVASGVKRPRSLRTYLSLLMLAATLPVLSGSFYIVQHVAKSYRDSSLHRLLDTTNNLRHSIEADLAAHATMLQVYAATTDVTTPQAMAKWLALTGMSDDSVLIVASARTNSTSQVSANTNLTRYIPQGLPQQAAASDEPVFSQLYFYRDAPRVAIAVRAKDDVDKILILTTTPRHLVSAAQDGSPDGLLIAVTDGTGRLLARSAKIDRYVGTQVPDWKKLKDLASRSGTFEAMRVDGGAVVFAFHEIKSTPGWVVVAGESLDAFNSRWQKPMLSIISAGLLALIVAVLLSTWVSRQLLRPIRQLTYSTDADHQQIDVNEQVLVVHEFQVLAQRLARSRAQLELSLVQQREIADALWQSERRTRTLAHAGAVVLWTLNPKGKITSLMGWEALVGQPDDQALGVRWLRQVHPNDVTDLCRNVTEHLGRSDRTVDVELRLRTRDGHWHWMRARGAAILNEQQCITEWLGVLEDVDERMRAQAAVTHQAHHDPLTGLPNRSLLKKHIINSFADCNNSTVGTLLYLDLDHFKQVNDTLGHAAGDALLCAVAERLRSLLRDTDLVVRLGGDEFCIVQHASSPIAASSLAQRVIQSLSTDYLLEGQRVNIGVSVGISMYLCQSHEIDPERLLREADAALYAAKKQGRGRFMFYTAELVTSESAYDCPSSVH